MKSSAEQQQTAERRSIDQSKIAYQKPQPAGMVPDVFFVSALELDGDEREWVPQSDTVAFRPLVLNVSQGCENGVMVDKAPPDERGGNRYVQPKATACRVPRRLRIRAARRDAHSGRSGRRQGDGHALSRDRRVYLRRSLRRGTRI